MTRQHVWASLLAAGAIAVAACEARSPVDPAPLDPSSRHNDAAANGQAATAVAPGAAAVTLCHVTGNGRYQLLTVGGNAEAAHRAHGDARVGETVPAAAGKVFDGNCEAVSRSFGLTSGTWMISLGSWPGFRFDVAGEDFVLSGTWDQAQHGPSLFYTAGTVVTITSVFQNATPQTIASFARGMATIGDTSYPFVELGGDLTFVTDPITMPTPAPDEAGQRLTVTVPFRMSGVLKGYDVLNRREPLLVFEVPVSGRGTATLELQAGPAGGQTLTTGRLTYTFTGTL